MRPIKYTFSQKGGKLLITRSLNLQTACTTPFLLLLFLSTVRSKFSMGRHMSDTIYIYIYLNVNI